MLSRKQNQKIQKINKTHKKTHKQTHKKTQKGSGLNSFSNKLFRISNKKNYKTSIPGTKLFSSFLNSRNTTKQNVFFKVIFNYRRLTHNEYIRGITTLSTQYDIDEVLASNKLLQKNDIMAEPHINISNNSRYIVIMYEKTIKNKVKLYWAAEFNFKAKVKSIFNYTLPVSNNGIVSKIIVKLYKYPLQKGNYYKKIDSLTLTTEAMNKKKMAYREIKNYIKENKLVIVSSKYFSVNFPFEAYKKNMFSMPSMSSMTSSLYKKPIFEVQPTKMMK